MTLLVTMPLKIIQISDPHLYAAPDQLLYGVNTSEALNDVIKAIKGRISDVDFVVVTGDLVHDETSEGYQRLLHKLEAFKSPCYVIPGNHDDPELMRACFSGGNIRWLNKICVKGWQFLFLNSHVKGEIGGILKDDDYAELHSHLQQSQLPTIIFIHHPPLNVGSAWLDKIGLKNSDRFLNTINKFPQIKAVVNGHIHQSFEYTADNGVLFYGTPSTCVQFKPHSDAFAIDESSPGWRVLNLFEDGHIESSVNRV
jgi:Icc protein